MPIRTISDLEKEVEHLSRSGSISGTRVEYQIEQLWEEKLEEPAQILLPYDDQLFCMMPHALVAHEACSGKRQWRQPTSDTCTDMEIQGRNILLAADRCGFIFDSRTGRPQTGSGYNPREHIYAVGGTNSFFFVAGNTLYKMSDDVQTIEWRNRLPGSFTSLAVYEEGNIVVTGLQNGEVLCWDATTGKERWKSLLKEPVRDILCDDTFVYAATMHSCTALSSRTGAQRWAVAPFSKIVTTLSQTTDALFAWGEQSITRIEKRNSTVAWTEALPSKANCVHPFTQTYHDSGLLIVGTDDGIFGYDIARKSLKLYFLPSTDIGALVGNTRHSHYATLQQMLFVSGKNSHGIWLHAYQLHPEVRFRI